MKLQQLYAAMLFNALLCASAFAEMPIESKEVLEGSWKLLQTRVSGDAAKASDRVDTWVFKGGKLTILHIPREGTFYDQPPVDYMVEDNKLKVSMMGRPDKFETFTLESKTDNKMTLIGKFNTYYDFIKQ